jgi:hypothetical protein
VFHVLQEVSQETDTTIVESSKVAVSPSKNVIKTILTSLFRGSRNKSSMTMLSIMIIKVFS